MRTSCRKCLDESGTCAEYKFGAALCRAGDEWERESWEGVAAELDESSRYFQAAARVSAGLESAFEAIAGELSEASTISGCISVGPLASVPNLLTLADEFDIVHDSLLVSTPSAAAAAQHFIEAATAIRKIVSSLGQ